MSLPRSLADPGKIRVDLRSDTVTLPPPGMLEAICRAELGDDVYGEDATVNRLESLSAERLGKEAAVLLPSGTMGNLLSLLAHCQRGQKVLVGDRSDIWLWEAGGASALGGLVYHSVPTGPGGELPIEELAAAVGEVEDPQCAAPGAICLETTHCMAGGRPLLDAKTSLHGRAQGGVWGRKADGRVGPWQLSRAARVAHSGGQRRRRRGLGRASLPGGRCGAEAPTSHGKLPAGERRLSPPRSGKQGG